MKSRVLKAIVQAKSMMRNQLPSQSSQDKLTTVGFKSISKARTHLDRYEDSLIGKKGQIAAFYDPNDHVIFFNKKMMLDMTEKMICEIFIHELLHAISNHSVERKNDRLVLLSGLKRQIFYGQKYYCIFKSLNEGFVQYLCNDILGDKSETYKNEAIFAEKLAEITGKGTLMKAFIGNDGSFVEMIEEKFGKERFVEACDLLDKGNYIGAGRLFETKREIGLGQEYQMSNFQCLIKSK